MGLSSDPRVNWVRASELTGNLTVEFDPFMEAMKPCDRVICFGLRGLKTGLHVPNDHIAAFERQFPGVAFERPGASPIIARHG